MPTEADPIIGNWYEVPEKGQKFEVVALDEDNGMVDIQYFDGDVDEIDLDNWYEMDIAPTEAPEDWTGPIDDVAKDDLGYTDTAMTEEEWSAEAKTPKRSRRIRLSDETEEEEAEEDEDYSEEEPWEGEL
jgi:hypothetical protein